MLLSRSLRLPAFFWLVEVWRAGRRGVGSKRRGGYVGVPNQTKTCLDVVRTALSCVEVSRSAMKRSRPCIPSPGVLDCRFVLRNQ